MSQFDPSIPTIRAIARTARTGITQTNTPLRGVTSEFVYIANSIHPEGREPSFVNAVLDYMARKAKPVAPLLPPLRQTSDAI